jgi:CheY-like chemotaxis protein
LNGILDYTKLSHGGTSPESKPVDISEVCRTTIELHSAAAVTKGLELRSRLDLPADGASHILSDEVKLFEIVNNLLSNALKFTRSGFVELQVQLVMLRPETLPKALLNIQVRDSGPGIPPRDHAKVFMPFFQGEGSAGEHTRAGGTGLGLSIVKELVASLDGEIQLESTQGLGSTFTIALPMTIAGFQHEAAPPVYPVQAGAAGDYPSDQTAAYEGRRLLLVDDNELNAWLACRLLQASGFDVVLAANGAIAVDRWVHDRFDVVLMDCQMPVLDGYAATRQIREHERSSGRRRTPIIAITANTLSGDRQECLAAGMDDYVGKPYSFGDLRVVLDRWLPARAASDGLPQRLSGTAP